MDVSQYLEIFLDETNEHITNLNTRIMELESDPENMDTINEIFRAAHSLKGMAGTMGFKRMQNLTHDMENVFSEVRNGVIKVNSEIIDVLFQCLDALEEYKDNIQGSADEGTNDNEPIIKMLNSILNGGAAPAKKSEAVKEAAPTDQQADGNKWDNVTLDDSQVNVIREAQKQGKKVYGLNVMVLESCILKAARAFLVFKAVEELGEIIVSDPSAQDVEDEKFDKDFTLIILSDAELDDVIRAAEAVSEIEKVVGAEVDLANNKSVHAVTEEEEASVEAEQKEETAVQEAAAPTAPAPAAAPTAPAAAKAEPKKQAPAKPVV
ncbi:MAG: Hpt domain-containing protein, partial [Muribaculaceae bacterium]|nr:Hpt domain-containing protein [Muribaculaceae bacterium]